MPAHVFVSDLEQPVLERQDLHHLQKVLRLRTGERLTISDGHGRWRLCRWSTAGVPDPIGEVVADAEPRPVLAVGFGLTKGDKGTLVVQKLTECGVDRIMPFVSERSVVRWDDSKAAAAVERWTRVAREAAMQCHRTWLPVVEPVTSFDAAAVHSATVMAHMDGRPLGAVDECILVGPEGGWSDRELRTPLEHVRLSPHILRAETAALAAGVLSVALRSSLSTS